MNVFAALERVLGEAVRDEAEVLAARDAWNAGAGAVHDDEVLYEERAAAFLDWFALDRRGPLGLTPVEQIIARTPLGAPEHPALSALASTHRSLFHVEERVAAGPQAGLLLEDLFGGGRFCARERRTLVGVERGDLLDARLIADIESPPDLVLGRIVCVHPREAAPAVRRLADCARQGAETREALLFRLLRLRLRCERYRHVGAARVYEAGDA